MSDADCQEPEGAAQPELRHPAGHPVRLRHCQGHQAARGVVSVMVFLPSHKQVAYIIIVDILFSSSNAETTKHLTLRHYLLSPSFDQHWFDPIKQKLILGVLKF